MGKPGRCQELVEEPWTDHSVVHRLKPATRKLAGCCARGASDDGVLIIGFGQPRINRANAEKSEERIALDEHARIHRFSKRIGQCRLASPGRTSDDEQRTHAAIVHELALPDATETPLCSLDATLRIGQSSLVEDPGHREIDAWNRWVTELEDHPLDEFEYAELVP
jgi:hypothetical protein